MKIIKHLSLLALLIIAVYSINQAQESTAEATESPSGEATPETTPQATTSFEQNGITVDLYFRRIAQGRVVVVGLHGNTIESATVELFNKITDFYKGTDGGFYALIAAEMNQSIRTYTMTINVSDGFGDPEVIPVNVDVTTGEFLQQSVTLVGDSALLELLNPEIESSELAQIIELSSQITDTPLWDERGFQPPIQTDLTSPFGAVRVFNETYNTIHTGWDYQASMGMPMEASASGRVVFAGLLPIRGNYVLIDHGRGLFSGYAHLSVIFVTQGQSVQFGQVIGLVGNTGRSSSAHAHIEFLLDGIWIDGADFLRTTIPR